MILLSGSPSHLIFYVCVYSTQVVVHWAIGNSKWKIETGKLELKSEQIPPNKEIHHFYSFYYKLIRTASWLVATSNL